MLMHQKNIIMFMCTLIANYEHILFMDNQYSSSNLFQKLQSIKTNTRNSEIQ